MFVNDIVAEIDGQIEKLQQAKDLLIGGKAANTRSVHTVPIIPGTGARVGRPRKMMSAASRKRIGDATRKRWALVKKQDKAAVRLKKVA